LPERLENGSEGVISAHIGFLNYWKNGQNVKCRCQLQMIVLLKANDTGDDVNVIMIADDSVYLVLWYKDGNPQPVYSYDARY
jgi:hypothetical protein